jgi:chloramphenicol-sensitive protein RarD
MAWFAVNNESAMTSGDSSDVLLLVLLGPVTAIPLLAFGGAATRIPLSTLGLLQYFTPVFQFLIGVLVFDEAMTPARWVGFLLVWLSLAVMSIDGLRHARTRVDDLEVVEPD